jgi:excisionase family DNA binding protein
MHEQSGGPNGDIMSNEQPKGNVFVAEILAYLEHDRYLSKKDASKYLSLSIRTMDSRTQEIPHFRVGKKMLFKKSELDKWMERYRESPQKMDLNSIVEDAARQVLEEKEYAKRRHRKKISLPCMK